MGRQRSSHTLGLVSDRTPHLRRAQVMWWRVSLGGNGLACLLLHQSARKIGRRHNLGVFPALFRQPLYPAFVATAMI